MFVCACVCARLCVCVYVCVCICADVTRWKCKQAASRLVMVFMMQISEVCGSACLQVRYTCNHIYSGCTTRVATTSDSQNVHTCCMRRVQVHVQVWAHSSLYSNMNLNHTPLHAVYVCEYVIVNYAYVRVYMSANAWPCVDRGCRAETSFGLYMHMYVCTYVHTCAYIHTCIHIHSYIPTQMVSIYFYIYT